jgi:hypothetical protein
VSRLLAWGWALGCAGGLLGPPALPAGLHAERGGVVVRWTEAGWEPAPGPLPAAPASPPGWSLRYDPASYRFLAVGPAGAAWEFRWFCYAAGAVTWSPDGEWLAYRADADDGSWSGGVALMRLADGRQWWLGEGQEPRWSAAAD